jgi:hypothetical protein
MDRTTPFTPRAPRRWELFTFALLGVTAASAFAGLVVLVTYLGMYRAVSTEGRSGTSAVVDLAMRHATGFDQIHFALVIAYLVAFSWWHRDTRRLLQSVGVTDAGAVKHWTVRAWNVLLLVSFAFRLLGASTIVHPYDADATRSELLSSLRNYAAGYSVRLLALVLLLIGVWRIRVQVRQAVATSLAAPTPRDLGLRPDPTPAAPLAPTRGDAALPMAALPRADDEFWARVSALSAAKGADLALLESTSTLVRRWLLVRAGDSIDKVRAAIPAGSVVTVFPEPLGPGGSAPEEPPAAEPGTEWFGLIEDAGMLRFQLLLPTRLPVWLAQARLAGRYGLYRADDPAALTAVMPSSADLAAGDDQPTGLGRASSR